MVYIFLGLGAFWGVLGVIQLVDAWGQTDGMKVALAQLVMAAFNVAIAWYLYWRRERKAGWRR